MKSWIYLSKVRQKLRYYKRRIAKPPQVLPLEVFFALHWGGASLSDEFSSNRSYTQFFFNPLRVEEYRHILLTKFPDAAERATERADQVLSHQFNLLGSGQKFLGEHIQWHTDFISGKEWPLLPSHRIDHVNLQNDSDVKVPWELSRLQYFTDIGRAYWITRDGRYLNWFIKTINDWEKKNPVGFGVNWICPMEIAIRAINIIWGIHFFSIEKSLNVDLTQRLLRLLYYHGTTIEDNLEIIGHGSNTNHLLSNYLGLFYLGLLFPEFDRSKHWRKIACEGLEKEILLEVFEDGVDYELSTSYHRLVTEIFLSAYLLGQRNGIEFSEAYCERLKRMLDYSLAITAPSGKAPLIGDNDDGFIVKLSHDDPTDHRSLIEVGRLALGSAVHKKLPISEERLWYVGPDACTSRLTTEKTASKLFKDGGYAVIQDEQFHLLFCAGKVASRNLAGHKHNDNLSFTLEINDTPFLIDAGNLAYTGDYRSRNLARSTSMHNTAIIDNCEQSRFLEKRLFYLFDDAQAKIDLWINTGRLVVVSGYHRGYSRLSDNILHRRTIWAFLDLQAFVLQDEFEGKPDQNHQFTTRFLTPQKNIRAIDSAAISITAQNKQSLDLSITTTKQGSLTVSTKDYFPRYGIRAEGRIVSYEQESRLPLKNTWTVSAGAFPLNWKQRLDEASELFTNCLESGSRLTEILDAKVAG